LGSLFNIGPLFFLASLVLPLGAALYLIIFANPPVPTTSAVLSTVNNVVEVEGVNETGFARAQEEQVLVAGDDVRTSEQGRGVITFSDPATSSSTLTSSRSCRPTRRRHRQPLQQSFSAMGPVLNWPAAVTATNPDPAGIVAVSDGALLRVSVGTTSSGQASVRSSCCRAGRDERADSSAAGVVIGAGRAVTAIEVEAIQSPPRTSPTTTLSSAFFALDAGDRARPAWPQD
jgi:hypothetical protein